MFNLKTTIKILVFLFTYSFTYAQSNFYTDFSSGVPEGDSSFATHIDNDGNGIKSIGDDFFFDDVGFNHNTGSWVDAKFTVIDTNTTIKSVIGTGEGSLKFNIIDHSSKTNNPYAVFELSLWNSDGVLGSINSNVGNEATVTNLTLQAYDIDKWGSHNFSDIFGYQSSTSSPVSSVLSANTQLEQQGFSNAQPGSVTEQFTNFALAQDSDSSDGEKFDDHIAISDTAPNEILQQYAVNLEYDSFHEGTFIWGVTGSDSSKTQNRGLLLSGSSPLPADIAPGAPNPPAFALMIFAALMALKEKIKGGKKAKA